MTIALLEREAELAALDNAVASAASGAGSVVLVSGDSGIGETSLVRAFLKMTAERARLIHGACDDLLAPRTFGPLRDAVQRGPLAEALAAGDRDAVLIAVLDERRDSTRPTVLVVEDVHWADDASLDVLRFVGQRVMDLHAVGLTPEPGPRHHPGAVNHRREDPEITGQPASGRPGLPQISRVPGWSVGPRSRPCNASADTPVSGRSATRSAPAADTTSASSPPPGS